MSGVANPLAARDVPRGLLAFIPAPWLHEGKGHVRSIPKLGLTALRNLLELLSDALKFVYQWVGPLDAEVVRSQIDDGLLLDLSLAIAVCRSDLEHCRGHRGVRVLSENDEGLSQAEDDLRTRSELVDRLLKGRHGAKVPSSLLTVLEEIAVHGKAYIFSTRSTRIGDPKVKHRTVRHSHHGDGDIWPDERFRLLPHGRDGPFVRPHDPEGHAGIERRDCYERDCKEFDSHLVSN